MKSKNVDWAKEEEKCFCEKWREDDEELGIQIVKVSSWNILKLTLYAHRRLSFYKIHLFLQDLHRTGSNLCTGPAATINQAKLKRILLGYARYNPEVGYCQVISFRHQIALVFMLYLAVGFQYAWRADIAGHGEGGSRINEGDDLFG